jgi:hypothetical protein
MRCKIVAERNIFVEVSAPVFSLIMTGTYIPERRKEDGISVLVALYLITFDSLAVRRCPGCPRTCRVGGIEKLLELIEERSAARSSKLHGCGIVSSLESLLSILLAVLGKVAFVCTELVVFRCI